MKKQSANKAPRKARRETIYTRLVNFPQARGRTVEKVR
jgi:hypothetical protein